jgi:hypothetical protein
MKIHSGSSTEDKQITTSQLNVLMHSTPTVRITEPEQAGITEADSNNGAASLTDCF